MKPRLLLIDNYDSFTYNLVQAFLVLGAEVQVFRNDAITPEAARELSPSHLCISPGPGTPYDAGVSMEMIRAFAGTNPGVRSLSGPPVHRRGIRRQGGACRPPHAWQDVERSNTTADRCLPDCRSRVRWAVIIRSLPRRTACLRSWRSLHAPLKARSWAFATGP